MSPTSGLPGTEVTVNGVNFNDIQWVRFDGIPAESFTHVSSTQFRAVVPANATSGRLTFGTSERASVWGGVFKVRPSVGGSPPPDTEPPTTPVDLRVTSASESAVSVVWEPSSDGIGVVRYELFRDGTSVGATTATDATFSDLPCGETFTFGVRAADAEENRSPTATVTASTLACTTPPPADDETPPSSPGNVRMTNATQTSVSVAWSPSSDDVEVAGYGLYRDDALVAATETMSATFEGLACGTRYVLAVDAFDAAGNRSPRVSLAVSTSSCSPPPAPGDEAGTTLTFTDTYWRCTRPVREYATSGLPLRVVMLYTRPIVPPNAGAVQLGEGCVGDGTPATDLILDIRGDGRTYGPGDDAIRIMNARPGARDLQIEGRANCGPKQGAAHQDGVQVLGGTNITFRNFEIGDYDAGLATCQGAGGAFFYSLSSSNVQVEGGKFIACNHGLFAGAPSGHVQDAMFRSARVDGTDPVCVGYSGSPPCMGPVYGTDVTVSNVTCERWNRTAGRWETYAQQ